MLSKLLNIIIRDEVFFTIVVEGIVTDIRKVDVETIKDIDLTQEADIDSLDIIEFSMYIEEEFDIEISNDEIENMLTLNDWVKLIKSKLDN